MDEFKNFDTVSDYNRFHNNDTLHPLVSVVDYSKSEPHGFFNMRLGFYAIILKDVKCGEMKYGRNFYDYDEDTLVFLAPGQAVKFVNTDVTHHPKGFALIFHPDLLRGTNLGKTIQSYSFFNFTGRGIYYSIFVNRHGMAYVSKVIMSNDELSFLTFRNYTSNVFKLDSAQVFLISLRNQVDRPSIRRWDTDNPHCEMFYNGIKIYNGGMGKENFWDVYRPIMTQIPKHYNPFIAGAFELQ